MLDVAELSIAEVSPNFVTALPLDQLMLSGLNVRKTERDADIAALAEDIAARGLKQNLVVVPAHFTTGAAESDWEGRYEVIAGGRRYQALALLAEAGRIPADHPVACLVEAREDARETSLSENLHKVSMNPADEFDAYAAIVHDWMQANAPGVLSVEPNGTCRAAIKACAKRFGKTVKHVDGRLRLATLAPEILQALRESTIGLDSAKAYAGTTDHKLQLKVFKDQAKSSWKTHDPRTVRDALRGKTVPATDPRVTFLGGIEAAIAAGCVVETEMFMGSDGVQRITNPAQLDKLVKARTAELLPEIAAKDGWKQALFGTRTAYDVAWPKAPEGYVRAHEWGKTASDITKAQRKKSIAVFTVARDGSGLEYVGRFKAGVEEPPQRGYVAPTPEERAETERQDEIDAIASRLAVGTFAGTPFEGRAFWPNQRRWVDAFDAINDDEVLVAVLVTVTADQIDAQREEAARRYDAKLAALAASPDAGEDDETDEAAD